MNTWDSLSSKTMLEGYADVTGQDVIDHLQQLANRVSGIKVLHINSTRIGGIRLQVINEHTGYLVCTPEGAALRMRYLLDRPDKLDEMGQKAKKFVQKNYLLTRQLREYLTVIVALLHGQGDRIELG